jgi:hypothetical protein
LPDYVAFLDKADTVTALEWLGIDEIWMRNSLKEIVGRCGFLMFYRLFFGVCGWVSL